MTLAVFAYIGRKIDEVITIRVNCLDEKRNIIAQSYQLWYNEKAIFTKIDFY